MALSILVVDDEKIQRETLASLLSEQGYSIACAGDLKEAIHWMSQSPLDVILTDFRMPLGNGIEVAKKAAELCPQCATIIMTAYADVQSVIESMRAGVVDYLLKPLNIEQLLNKLRFLENWQHLQKERTYLRAQLNRSLDTSRLLGSSGAMVEVRRLIDRVAGTKGSVLITGESGTGKEIAARQIHLKSPRSERHFVAINCSAIPENLLESELFGHKKGAFTGATNDKEGLFLIAHGGTLFLDEIGEMPKTLQVKLLRALQEREVTPVGATASIRVDVRIIAATNRDILSAVEKGEFRKDLYYRINVVELKMPPLREHAVDIPSLAQHFVQKYAIELGRAVKGINFEALKKLTFYAWPGNVRELENVIERAIILNKEAEWIALSDLPSGFQNLGEEANNPYNLDDAIRTVSRTFIANALEAAGGDKKKAAGLLGMGLSSLYRKLEELGISSSREPGSQ